MNIRIRLRPLGALAVAVLALGLGVHWWHDRQVRGSIAVLVGRAERAGRDGKVGEQLDLLRRYLAYKPEDTDTLQLFGTLLAGSGARVDLERAMETLDRVVARDPSRSTARRLSAGLALKLGELEAARAHYEALASSSPGGDADAEEALGRCEEALKRHPEAIAWLEKAIEHDPGRVEAHARLARLLRARLGKPERADLVMDAREVKAGLIARNPGSARARLERASYRREYAIPGAEEDIARALALAPDDADVLMAAARVAPVDEALRLLGRGSEKHPDDPRFYEGTALVEAAAGRPDRAVDVLARGVARIPADLNLRWVLAGLALDAGLRDRAALEIGHLRGAGFPPAPLDFLDARILVDSGRWTEAARQLAKTAPTLESVPGAVDLAKRAFVLLARCHRRLGNADMWYAAARRAVALEAPDPGLAVAARVELSSALAGSGKLDEAAESYRIALRMPGARSGILVDLGRVLVAKNLRLPPQQRRWEEVGRVLDDSEAASPGSSEVAILRAEILAGQERLDAAGEGLKRAEAAHPDEAGPKVALAALAERRGRPGEALAILSEARKRLGDRPELLGAMVQYWSSRPVEAGSRALAGLVEVADKVADETARRDLLSALADGLARVGDAARSASLRDRLVAEQPDHLGLRLAQLETALQAGDLASADRVVDEVRRIEGSEGSLWRYGRAQVLIRSAAKARDLRGLDEARTLLAEARERRPGWGRAILALAELDDLRGDPGSALRGYLAALEGGERDPGAVRRAVQLLYGRGRFAQADALLRRAQQEGALSPDLGRLAADVAMQARDVDRAIDLARRAVAGRPDSAADQTWLGQLLLAAWREAEEGGRAAEASARRSEADKALARGVELAPADPDAQVARILALVAWGRGEEARAAIGAAEATLRGPAAELALARCLAAVGRSAESEAKYRAILRDRPDDVQALQASALEALKAGKIRDAEPHLRRLIGLRSKTPREAAWARRVLALALSVEGRGGGAKARKLLGLDEDSTADPASAEGRVDLPADDLRARAQVVARQPGRASRRKAVAMLDALIARDEARPGDLLLRAQILAADGDWKRARASAQQLLAADPSSPALLEFLARGQIASGNPAEAMPWVDELARLLPRSPVVVELRARALFAGKKPEEAVALLVGLADREPSLREKVSGLLEEAGRPREAEVLLRRMMAEGPGPRDRADGALALAGLLGRLGRNGEAVATCEPLWADPAIPPARVSTVALRALYTARPDEAALLMVDRSLKAALARAPSDIVLRFDSANLAILRGRYAEAESMLRDLQRAEPELGAPLNNLAWLLAIRGASGPEPVDLIDRAIALDGPLPDMLDTRGLILTLRGQPDRAVEDLEEAIAAVPSPSTYLHLAQALRKAGRPAEAAEALARARASGLRPADIHPLERPAYLELVAALPKP